MGYVKIQVVKCATHIQGKYVVLTAQGDQAFIKIRPCTEPLLVGFLDNTTLKPPPGACAPLCRRCMTGCSPGLWARSTQPLTPPLRRPMFPTPPSSAFSTSTASRFSPATVSSSFVSTTATKNSSSFSSVRFSFCIIFFFLQ